MINLNASFTAPISQHLVRPTPLAWIGLHALALWPHGAWALQRSQDGSDDPLGLAALALLAWLVWRERRAMRVSPRLPWLLGGVCLLVLATLALNVMPPLVAAIFAALSFSCGIVAWLPGGSARLPFAGLALLSLPLIASLQFYGGYPLRVITAQLSAWGLQLVGMDAVRSGASMTVQGQLVIVDAPCSGVQMIWMAYFAACAVASLTGLRDGVFMRRLPWLSLIVLLGNALRNSVLVALESRPEGLGTAAHEAIGLAALALTTLMVVRLYSLSNSLSNSLPLARLRERVGVRVVELRPTRSRGSHKLSAFAMALAACALLPLARPQSDAAHTSSAIEWPTHWEGATLRPLALSNVEHRFAQGFPGQIARFTDGASRVFVMRHVTQPTRMLHPAVDCFRATGYSIQATRLERDSSSRLWRCFEAERQGERVRVCERIEGPQGEAFTDASSWFWAASLGSSVGPWRAVTVVEAL